MLMRACVPRYVQLMESALCEALTQHRRDESGQYGRRSSAPISVHDVYVYPHMYGALVQHKEGCTKLLHHPHLHALIQVPWILLLWRIVI